MPLSASGTAFTRPRQLRLGCPSAAALPFQLLTQRARGSGHPLPPQAVGEHERGALEAALPLYERALALNDRDQRVHKNLAAVRRSLGITAGDGSLREASSEASSSSASSVASTSPASAAIATAASTGPASAAIATAASTGPASAESASSATVSPDRFGDALDAETASILEGTYHLQQQQSQQQPQPESAPLAVSTRSPSPPTVAPPPSAPSQVMPAAAVPLMPPLPTQSAAPKEAWDTPLWASASPGGGNAEAGFDRGEATRDPEPTVLDPSELDLSDAESKPPAAFTPQPFADYLAKRNAGVGAATAAADYLATRPPVARRPPPPALILAEAEELYATALEANEVARREAEMAHAQYMKAQENATR